ncbi:hypothetical protein F383_28180 [Gossypium arboreum]|uniref:Uncharacterized protein n=1 Tax=Gossypium arboreum TaxID=29729 RepID=A0A0B0P7M4_GOSAR|nr:hypothetical protein F383_28180 [Gossypium arboreum]
MDPRGKSTRLGLSHMGRSHARAHLTALTKALSNCTRACPCQAQV